MYLFENSTNQLMGKMPEALALMIFGVSLIISTIVIRKLVVRKEQLRKNDIELN
jgi:hypothetical protein